MRQGEASKARIAEAAMRLVAEGGVAAATTKAIAAAVGVSEGLIYKHFPSKDALLGRLFWEGFDAYGRFLAEVAGGRADAEGRLDAMVRELCRLADEDWTRFAFLLLVQHGSLGEQPTDLAGAMNPVDVVRGVVAEARPEADADLLTAMVIGVVLQAATFRVYGRIRRDMRDMAPEIAAACRRVVLG
jgi:AcrR family transcriptional regulator